VALPDETPRRPAVIFGSALLATGVETLLAKTPGVTVVLCGSSVDIRKHLVDTRVQHLVLASVFPQTHLQSDASHMTKPGDSIAVIARHLPKVICVLSPSEPQKILDRYRPHWIAAECQREQDALWLEGVANWARQRQTPVVGWISGERGAVVEVARKHHIRVFQWPLLQDEVEKNGRDSSITGAFVVARERHLVLTPLLMRGEASDMIANLLGKANALLARCQSATRSSTAEDCLRLAWRYARTVEWLPVPVSFYEEESEAFWGLKSLGHLRQVTGRFASAIRHSDPEVAKLVDEAITDTDSAVDLMRQDGVPVWESLKTLCIGSSNGKSPTDVRFLARSRRRLVELALLGLEGVTLGDLSDVGIRLTDITQRLNHGESSGRGLDESLAAPGSGGKQWDIVLVGLPNKVQLGHVYSRTGRSPLRVLLYPYQVRLLQSRLEQYAQAAGINDDEQVRALRECGVSVGIDGQALGLAAEMKVNASTDVAVHAGRRSAGEGGIKPTEWGRFFSDSEVNALLGTGEDEGEAIEDLIDEVPTEPNEVDIAVEKAIELAISGRRRGLFTADYAVNVVRVVDGKDTIVERTVRSLKAGDRLVLVHGQRRQSLYELLLTRVHRHPSLQLHLALIRAWQDEIRASFSQWKASGKGYTELLAEMQRAGSTIQSALALRFWTEGNVLCPQDTLDLPRIANVLGMKFTGEHHARIAKAAERLRGLHRGLALRLTHWLRRQAAGTQLESDDDVIDAELGLTLRDFKDSLEVVTVEVVVERQGLYLAATLNLFRSY
jgi:hypothetical protein